MHSTNRVINRGYHGVYTTASACVQICTANESCKGSCPSSKRLGAEPLDVVDEILG
jgi:hypothetical protein